MIHFSYSPLLDKDNKSFCLQDIKERFIILYFYPKDNTPGCTIQANKYSQLMKEFQAMGVAVVGVGKGDCKSKTKFVNRYQLEQIMASDVDFKLGKLLNVAVQKKMFNNVYWTYTRSSFVIDMKNLAIMKSQKPAKALNDANENLLFLKDYFKNRKEA